MRLGPSRFRLQSLAEGDYGEPADRLCVSFLSNVGFPLFDLNDLDPALSRQIEKVLWSGEVKFARYVDCRRVLVLKAYGDLRWQRKEWWAELLRARSGLDGIEVWLCSDNSTEDWDGALYGRVFPWGQVAVPNKPVQPA